MTDILRKSAGDRALLVFLRAQESHDLLYPFAPETMIACANAATDPKVFSVDELGTRFRRA